jgi:alpha-glucosidase
VFWDNSYRGAVDLGRANPSELKFSAEGGELRYYLFANPDIKKIVSRYTELTGRPKLPPLWSLGYQQCRWSYYPESTVLDIAAQFRKRKIPCDVLYLDIHYMDGYRVFTWDQKSFPDLKGMIDKLHQQGFKVIVILDPGIKIDPNYAVYKSGVERDVFLKYPDGKMARGPVWPGMCHFPDFSKPATREWWVEHSQAIFDLGIDGVWNDMCEPTIFSSSNILTLADAVRHDNEGNGGDHVEHHNVYGMLMGRASSEAFDKYRPNTRPVNIIRAGYAGAQRYAMSWTGDNRSDWDHLALSIPMTLSMGLCGAPITGPDIGGFRGEGEGELFIRWLQAAALMPYFRTHTALDTPQQEPWSYGDKIEALSRETIKLRYRLLPYLYSLFAQASEYGYPIIRPLFMAEPQNPELRSIDDCYLVGDALLVAPILQKGAVSRSVYLPAGQWYDFWTNTGITGGRMITVKAPLERLPLFVRAGTVLPLWPEMDYVGQKDINEITLRVYPGAGETTLYEDAGEGKGYQQGDYRWVYMSTEIDGSKLYVKRRAAGRYQPAYSSIRVEFVLQDLRRCGFSIMACLNLRPANSPQLN